jgi:Tfp pilus assembly major pilin PilA
VIQESTGFSLIALMIVAATIGMLAAIAISLAMSGRSTISA